MISEKFLSAPLQWAFVCGHPLENSAHKSLFRDFGVMHLLVVSGSHLVWLELILQKFIRSKKISLLLLLTYCAICLWQPPVVRAWIQMMFRSISEKFGLQWSSTRLTILSGIVLMTLIPHWIESLSFHMSLLASIAISFRPETPLRGHILVILLMYPLTLSLSPISPTTLIASFILTPILSLALFPLTVLGFFFSGLQPINDQVWITTLNSLDGLDGEFVTTIAVPETPFWLKLFYCLFVLGVLWNFGFSKSQSPRPV